MRTLPQVLVQIEKLNIEADRLRAVERDGVLQRIQEAMSVYHITMEELATPVKPKAAASPVAKKENGHPAYTHGVHYTDGKQVWVGHAKMPNWLIDHMLKTGKSIGELAVPDKQAKKA